MKIFTFKILYSAALIFIFSGAASTHLAAVNRATVIISTGVQAKAFNPVIFVGFLERFDNQIRLKY